MIAISDLNKQYGTKVLYKNASLQIKPGEKIGLVGPNGAGKTSIFRIIVGEESFDSGTLSKPEKWVIGYFSQDVGEMKGRSALEEVMAGAGRVSDLAAEMKKIENRLIELSEDPGDGEEMTKILERFGELQLEFEQRGGYDLESDRKSVV